MLRKSLLSTITSSLLKRNVCIADVAYHSALSTTAHMDPKEADNTNIKKLNNKIEEIKLNIKKMESKSTSENEKHDLVKYLTENLSPEIIVTCPNVLKYMKTGGKYKDLLYLIDNRVAAEFVSIIIDDLLKDTCFVAELNPGFGILTTELLKANIPLIHLYEEREEFDSVLENLSNIYPGRLDRRRFSLLKINILMYLDKMTKRNEMAKVFEGVECKKWEDKCMQVIGMTSSTKFMEHIIFSLLFRNSFMTYGRTVFYIAIPPSIWHKYTCDKSNNTTKKVLFQLMFNYKLLGKLERKAFLPWLKKRKKKRRCRETEKLDEMDYNEMFVVKLEPKTDIYSRLSQDDWIKFWYFIRHTRRRRSNRVIPEIEKWIPGSGVRIIAQCNYTIFTEFGDLTSEEFLKLFKKFQSWPEYKTSSFLNSMKDSLSTFDEPAVSELIAKDDNIHD